MQAELSSLDGAWGYNHLGLAHLTGIALALGSPRSVRKATAVACGGF